MASRSRPRTCGGRGGQGVAPPAGDLRLLLQGRRDAPLLPRVMESPGAGAYLRRMSDAPRTEAALRLGSYNIRKAVGLDWRRDPARILRVINRLDADVIALQEADKRLGQRHAALDPEMIARETDLRVVAPLGGSPVSLGWHGNAMLVRKGVEVQEVERIALPGIEPRGGLLVRFGSGPRALTVVGVHLGLRRACRRLQFAKILTAIGLKALDRAVILGDFNEWSNRAGLERLDHHFEVISPGRSFHAARPVAALDRIALGRELRLAAAGLEAGPDARIASDHLPVWAELRLRDAPDDLVRRVLSAAEPDPTR